MTAERIDPPADRPGAPRRLPLRNPLDVLYLTLSWLDRHVRGFYAAIGAYLALGLIIALGTLGLLAFLAEIVARGWVQSIDDAIVIGLRRLDSPVLDALALLGAGLGSGAAAWLVILTATLLFWSTHHRYSVYLLWISLGGARILNTLMKEWFARPRPAFFQEELRMLRWTFDFPASPSFPSGHALTATVIFSTVAYLVARLEPTRWLRRATFALAGLAIALVGLSRIYLGVHFPSDVLAGVLAGFMWATTAALGIEAVRYFRGRKPEVERDERDLDEGIRPPRETLGG